LFTPFQVQFTRDLEWYFIRENKYKLEEINKKQEEVNLKNYEPGNILLIHLDFAKTASRFAKKRRTFNKLVRFISYDFGNVKCYFYNVIERHIKNHITIPIYYTKYIAENERSIPPKYKELLGSVKN
jgi:tRNA U34 5-carboxymethylaminomethyl modifying enzyme MnmG/GidA